jgi:hypothetical protein
MAVIPHIEDPMDPSEQEWFVGRFKDLLVADTLASIVSVTVDAGSVALGVTVMSGSDQPTIIDDPVTNEVNTAIKCRIEVNDSDEGLAIWNRYGREVLLTFKAIATSGRPIERSMYVPIRQM